MGVISTIRQAIQFGKNDDGRTRWAFMKTYKIPSAEDPTEVYLWRLRIIQTPMGGIYLHKIRMTDGDRDLHDHPYAFVSVILKGGYTEEYVRLATSYRDRGLLEFMSGRHAPSGFRAPERHHGRFSVNVMRSTAAHRIRRLDNGRPVWSLMFVGPRVQKWGFWTQMGFVPWDEYVDNNNQKKAIQ